jgi:hypothetical protein
MILDARQKNWIVEMWQQEEAVSHLEQMKYLVHQLGQ